MQIVLTLKRSKVNNMYLVFFNIKYDTRWNSGIIYTELLKLIFVLLKKKNKC